MNDSGKKINPNNEKFLNELGRASCDIALGYVTKRLSDRFKDKYSDSVKSEVFRLPIVSRIEMSKFLHSEEELDAFIEGKPQRLGAGDLVIITPGDKHYAMNPGKTEMRFVAVHTPAVSDYEEFRLLWQERKADLSDANAD